MAPLLLSNTLYRRLPLIAGVTFVGIMGVRYSVTRRPLLMDANGSMEKHHGAWQEEATKTLSFPRTMLFSKELTVSKVEQVNHDTKRITFALPGGESESSGVPGGSAILTQHTPAGRWFPVLRPYTPVHDPSARGLVQLLVKHYPGGAASTHMHSLAPGQTITVRGPIPGYSWKPCSTPRDVLFVAGGAGITPIYSLTNSILRNPDDQARIQVVWGVNGTRDIILREEFESLEKQYPDRLRVTYCVSGSDGADAAAADTEGKYRSGYVDRGTLQEAIDRFKTGAWGDEKGTKVFLCGPPAMEEAIAGNRGALRELGVEKKSVHKF